MVEGIMILALIFALAIGSPEKKAKDEAVQPKAKIEQQQEKRK